MEEIFCYGIDAEAVLNKVKERLSSRFMTGFREYSTALAI